MKKRLSAGLLSLVLSLLLAGCWDYRDITKLDIVSGIAVDWLDDAGTYLLTMEIVNVGEGTGGNVTPLYVESEGPTIFEAMRNAKRRLANELFLGNTQVMIISRQLAEREGILPLIDVILRNSEPRETMNLIIAQDDTAASLLYARGIDVPNDSFNMRDIIRKDQKFTGSSENVPIYQAYNAIKDKGVALVLPSFRCTNNGQDEEMRVESYGLALFRGDKLAGFLSPEDARDFLIAGGRAKGGAYSVNLYPDGPMDISLNLKECVTQTSASVQDGRARIALDVRLGVTLIELKAPLNTLLDGERARLEVRCAEVIGQRVAEVIRKAQDEYRMDIWGFGNLLYKSDPALWASVESDWDEWFCVAELDIRTSVRVLSAGITGGY